jgi:hypothetical protein
LLWIRVSFCGVGEWAGLGLCVQQMGFGDCVAWGLCVCLACTAGGFSSVSMLAASGICADRVLASVQL